MDPVVVGVDGSPSSLEAVEIGAREARLRGVGVRLVHAFGRPSVRLPPGGHPWNPATAGVRERVDGTLTEAEERAREVAPQLDVRREVTVGKPVTVLETQSRAASLVVVGSRGPGALGNLLLGSTAGPLAAHGRWSMSAGRTRERTRRRRTAEPG